MSDLPNEPNEKTETSERSTTFLRTRKFLFHDGRTARRFAVSPVQQAMLAGAAVMTLSLSAYGAVQATRTTDVDAMEAQVARMRADVAAVRDAAKVHAARVEQRQALIAAVLSGEGDPEQLAQLADAPQARIEGAAAQILAPLQRVEDRQVAFATAARNATETRIAATERHLKTLGVKPARVLARAGMGGPYMPLDSKDAEAAAEAGAANADAQFRSLFQSWKKLDTLEQAVISIPSLQPVENVTYSSTFGVRSDPFRGTAAMHAGLDIPGPVGTPVYATADGIVSRAQRAGGYGNLVEINHGKGIQTRYGHLSKIVIGDNVRVRRGQLIGLMGSTGRSTGSHLHYEVRIGGRPVNPMPYMQSADVLLSAQDKALRQRAAVGGPIAK